MRMRLLSRIVFALTGLVQIALLAVVYVLQVLTTKKAGVNHHLRFTRTYWMHNYLTPQNLLILSIVLVLLAVLVLVIYLRRRKNLRPAAKAALLLVLIWIAALLLSLHLEAVQALLSYPYLLLAEGIGLLLSGINAAVASLTK